MVILSRECLEALWALFWRRLGLWAPWCPENAQNTSLQTVTWKCLATQKATNLFCPPSHASLDMEQATLKYSWIVMWGTSHSPYNPDKIIAIQYGEQKTDKEKSHKDKWEAGMPLERPGDKFGTSQGHPGRLGRFMWKFTFKGQNVRGTDGTQTRGCPTKILYVYWFFLSPFKTKSKIGLGGWPQNRTNIGRNYRIYFLACLTGLFPKTYLWPILELLHSEGFEGLWLVPHVITLEGSVEGEESHEKEHPRKDALLCLQLEDSCLVIQFSFVLTVVLGLSYLQLELLTYSWRFRDSFVTLSGPSWPIWGAGAGRILGDFWSVREPKCPKAEERLSGALRQSVPQNGRVHLHIIDFQKAQRRGFGVDTHLLKEIVNEPNLNLIMSFRYALCWGWGMFVRGPPHWSPGCPPTRPFVKHSKNRALSVTECLGPSCWAHMISSVPGWYRIPCCVDGSHIGQQRNWTLYVNKCSIKTVSSF